MNETFESDNLENLLSEPISSVIKREQSTFDELSAPFEKSLVLFGAGGLGKKTLAGLRKLGIEPLAFADNNPAVWGKIIDGVRVYSLKDAADEFGQKSVFVITIWNAGESDTMNERQNQAKELNCSKVIPFSYLYWKYSDIFLPYYGLDLPHKVLEQAESIKNTFSLWADDSSRHEYISQLRWRLLMDFFGLPTPVAHTAYFPDDLLTIRPDEVFVDCGAFDGDTIKSFLLGQSSFSGKIIAFEPDIINFQKLEEYSKSSPYLNNIIIYPHAIGAQKSILKFESTGTSSSFVGSGNLDVECVTLDEFLSEQNPTYIKMDIEGSEIDALLGAQNIIKKYLPILAISAYHRSDHLWRIPALINSYSDQYRFFLRPHHLEVWDLVCYAIPLGRLLS